MIINLERFLETERPYWDELAAVLDRLEKDAAHTLTVEQAERFHYLYQRVSSDLAGLASFPSEPRLRQMLESLVARAYAEIHETRAHRGRFRPVVWLTREFPATFRRHLGAFAVLAAAVFLGVAFGSFVIHDNEDLKRVLLPFGHLQGSPEERVAHEEEGPSRIRGRESEFAGYLMTHNIQVAILSLAMGVFMGVGTLVVQFYNGVILGAVALDYIQAGQLKFLAGWILPHGVIEIPAFMIAGQAGLVLGWAIIGWGNSLPLRRRLRAIRPDLLNLMLGTALLLVWAGVIEAFFSQYHEPVLPYTLKIIFGLVELTLLVAYLTLAGRKGSHAAV